MASSRSKILLWYLLFTGVTAFAVTATWFQLTHHEPPLEKLRPLPDFELTERSDRPLRLAHLKGKVWLADFIYTTCPGPCPMLTSRFAALQKDALGLPDVRFVSISTDPEKDTPEVLRQYAEHFQAVPEKWLFLTGEKPKVHGLIQNGFTLAVLEQPGQPEPIVHSTKIALVDKAGVIRKYYDGTDATPEANEEILRDIRRLLRERSE